MDKRFEFQRTKTGIESSRQFCLAGSLATRIDLTTEMRNLKDETLALENAQFFVRECLRDGFMPVNFPPLQPVDFPQIVCAMALPAEIKFCRGNICRWLTMYRFSGMQPEEMKKIWQKTSEYHEGSWKEIPIPNNFFDYAVKRGKVDRFCWRELNEEGTGQTFVEILALSGDPGLKAICSFTPPFEISGDFTNDPGFPILGVSIRRPAGVCNTIFLRDGSEIDF